MNDITIINPSDLKTLISEVVEEKLQRFSIWLESKIIQEDKPLKANQAMEYLGMSKATFYRYTKSGAIPQYGTGTRIYYKKSELDEFAYSKKLN